MDAVVLSILSLSAAAALYILVPKNKYRSIYIGAAFLALVLRFIMVFYLYRNGTDTFGTDGLLYHNEGIAIAKQLEEGIPVYGVHYSYTWYTVLVGVIYSLFGIDRYIPSFINSFLAVMSSLIMLRIALKQKYGFKNAAFISLAILYFPNMFLWTTDTRKESLLIFVCLAGFGLLQGISAYSGKDRLSLGAAANIALFCFLMWISTLIRIYMLMPFFSAVIASQYFVYLKKRSRVSLVFASAVTVAAAVIFFWTFYPLLQNYHAVTFPSKEVSDVTTNLNSKITVIADIAGHRNLLASLLDSLTLPSPLKIDIPDIRGMSSIIRLVRLDMLAWYACLLLEAIGIFKAIKTRNCFLTGIISFIAVYLLINAALVENVADTIYRYRAIIVALSMFLVDGSAIRGFVLRLHTILSRGNFGEYIYK